MRRLLLPLGLVALTACATPVAAPAAANSASGTVAVRPAGYALQGAPAVTVLPFAKQHLVRVELYLAKVTAGVAEEPALAETLVAGALDRKVRFQTLAAGATYQISAKAFQPANAADPTSLVEAQDPARSVTAFQAVGGQALDLDQQGGIVLTLKDRTFQGQATGGIAVTPGAFESTTAPEGVVLP